MSNLMISWLQLTHVSCSRHSCCLAAWLLSEGPCHALGCWSADLLSIIPRSAQSLCCGPWCCSGCPRAPCYCLLALLFPVPLWLLLNVNWQPKSWDSPTLTFGNTLAEQTVCPALMQGTNPFRATCGRPSPTYPIVA